MDSKVAIRRRVLIILFLFTSVIIHSQNYKQFSIKEEYDYFNMHLMTRYNPLADITGLSDEVYGDGMGYVLESYITMYETTQDKAYLYKFVIQSLSIMKNRHDSRRVDYDIPRWDNTPSSMYKTGNTIAPLARFVYFIKNNPSLYNTPMYAFDNIKNNAFEVTFSTFGDYANWLQDRCGETLWWFISNGYWIPNGFRRLDENSPAEINQQVGFGRALLYIGLSANDASLLLHATIIADQFKSTVSIKDKCFGPKYHQPVFQTTANNAYKWYHVGWRVMHHPCNNSLKNYKEYTKYIEDISHGVHSTWLVNDFLKFQPNTSFEQIDMIRFKNMFAKNIYAGNGNFHNAVDEQIHPSIVKQTAQVLMQ